MREHETTENPARASLVAGMAHIATQHDERARRERAFTRYCQGWRLAQIASLLGVETETVHAWITAELRALERELPHDRASQRARAIASQLAIAAAAWDGYQREHERETERDEFPRPSQAHRYLSIALAAEREIARLQGLHTPGAPAPSEVRIVLERLPDGPAGPAELAAISGDPPAPLSE